MRLINTNTLELRDFNQSELPQYAILSHTWEDEDEVSFQEFGLPNRSSKKGYSKILQTCRLALRDGLEYAWVDTCCIDKSSSAELTESVNSHVSMVSKCRIMLRFSGGSSTEHVG